LNIHGEGFRLVVKNSRKKKSSEKWAFLGFFYSSNKRIYNLLFNGIQNDFNLDLRYIWIISLQKYYALFPVQL
jgi:hypothetical protein